MQNPTDDPRRQRTDRMVARVSEHNRTFAAAAVLARRNKGRKESSTQHFLNVLCKADAYLGRPFGSVGPDDLALLLGEWRSGLSDRTVALHAVHLRTMWKDVLDADMLPRAFRKALAVPEPERKVVGRALKESEFADLLRAVIARAAAFGARMIAMFTALVWLLRDGGLRARELIALNVGSVVFEEREGVHGATVTIPADARDLKTGPRAIFVSQCASVLKAWIALHPAGSDQRAPLFIGVRDATGQRRLAYKEVYKLIKRGGAESGIANTVTDPENLTPHDLRHTSVTEKARLPGWNEEKLRTFYGWKPGSDMPSYYAHLTVEDLREQVYRDQGINHLGARRSPAASSQEEAMMALLKKLVAAISPEGLAETVAATAQAGVAA